MRRTLPVLLLSILPLLQGCFPVVATGVGTTVLMLEDRRTSGTVIEDQGIEFKASGRIDEKYGDKAHINITSYNRSVLLTGEAPGEAARQDIETLVRGVQGVSRVLNEIGIGAPTALSSRANDSYLTSRVKARFVDANRFQANHVKVVTENGVVYLLGLVTRKEAADAAEIASTTGDVKKVVKVFEYLD